MQILEADERGLLVRLSRDESVQIAGGLLLAAMVRQKCSVGDESERALLQGVAQRLLLCGLVGAVGGVDALRPPAQGGGGWWGWLRRWMDTARGSP